MVSKRHPIPKGKGLTFRSSKKTKQAFATWKAYALREAPPSIRGCTAIQTLKRSKCAKKYHSRKRTTKKFNAPWAEIENIFQNDAPKRRAKKTKAQRIAYQLQSAVNYK